MSSQHLRNITIAKYEAFLELAGCKYIRTKSGHAHYSRSDLFRPITFQTHVDPVPEFIIKNALRQLDISKKEFFEILSGKIQIQKKGKEYLKIKVGE